jgi:predicted nuclease of predicted toxin-antitoxin system
MRIKIDENLPARLMDGLAQLGHDVDSVPDEGLRGRDDAAVWRAAQTERRFLITQDLHFSDVRIYAPGTHCGILLLRLRNPSASAMLARVLSLFQTEDVSRWTGAFLVASERKLRIRWAGR